LSLEEAARLQGLRDSYDTIARNYKTTSTDKREALDTIFGPATFTSYGFDLESVLNACIRMEASRKKALGQE
jgi:hypothetical protein